MSPVALLKRIRWALRRTPRATWLPLVLRILQRASGRAAVSLPPRGEERRVVFVCHGNIMRSAFAGALLRARLEAAGAAPDALAVSSAGTHAKAGRGAHADALASASGLGVALAEHRATPLGEVAVQPGDLLVGFDVENEVPLRARVRGVPGAWAILLGDVETPGTLGAEVRDPWGRGERVTTETFERIVRLVDQLRARIA